MITPLIAHIDIDVGELKVKNNINNTRPEAENEDEVTSTLEAEIGGAAHQARVEVGDNNLNEKREFLVKDKCDEQGILLHQSSPILFLRYLYLYVDPIPLQTDHTYSSSMFVTLIQDLESQMLPRHALASITCLPMDSVKTLAIGLVNPESVIKSAFDRFGMSAAFFYVKVSLDTINMPQGDFSSLLLLESPLTSLISCTTAIYSYGEKILETKQVKTLFRQCEGSSFVYRFDYLHDYWTAFLNGFMFLEGESEVRVAVESVNMIQTFHAISEDCNQLPLLTLAYDFHVGDGSVAIFLVV